MTKHNVNWLARNFKSLRDAGQFQLMGRQSERGVAKDLLEKLGTFLDDCDARRGEIEAILNWDKESGAAK